MDLLTFKVSRQDQRHPGDVDRLVRVAARWGCLLPPADAERVWEDYSSCYAAGWMNMSDMTDEDLYSIIDGRCSRRPLD